MGLRAITRKVIFTKNAEIHIFNSFCQVKINVLKIWFASVKKKKNWKSLKKFTVMGLATLYVDKKIKIWISAFFVKITFLVFALRPIILGRG